MFGGSLDGVQDAALELLTRSSPSSRSTGPSSRTASRVVDLLRRTVAGSKTAARKLVQQGGAYVNNVRITDGERTGQHWPTSSRRPCSSCAAGRKDYRLRSRGRLDEADVTVAVTRAAAFRPTYRKTRRGLALASTLARCQSHDSRPRRARDLPLARLPTSESLAERLREGPLRTLLTLHVRAGTLVALPETDAARAPPEARRAHAARAHGDGAIPGLHGRAARA